MSWIKYLLLLATALAMVAEEEQQRTDLPDGFELSDPLWFGNDRSSTRCYWLSFKNRALGYVAVVSRAGENLVLKQCTTHVENPHERQRTGAGWVNGWTKGWFLIQPDSLEYVPIELTALNDFSRPYPCGTRIAYWGSERLPDSSSPGKEYFAFVADLNTREMLKKEHLGEAWIATGFTAYLPKPKWNEDCSEVLFDEPRHFKPVTLKFPALDFESP